MNLVKGFEALYKILCKMVGLVGSRAFDFKMSSEVLQCSWRFYRLRVVKLSLFCLVRASKMFIRFSLLSSGFCPRAFCGFCSVFLV